MIGPFQNTLPALPAWAIRSGVADQWQAANPATRRDWQRNPAWRPRAENTLYGSTTPIGPAWDLSTGAVPAGLNDFQRDPIEGRTIRSAFTDAIAEMGRGKLPGVIPGAMPVSETPEQVAARLARWQQSRNPNPGTQPPMTVKAQTPWFSNPWTMQGQADLPYWQRGLYGRGA